MASRLVLAIVSTVLEEIALFVIWRWGLPQLDINLPLYVLVIIMVGWATYSVATFWIVTHILRKQTVVGLPTMVEAKGKVVNPLKPEGLINIRGELWGARSLEEYINNGEKVTVVGQDGLKLIVRKDNADKPVGK
jgi:membrane-bound ClpP family serine protease